MDNNGKVTNLVKKFNNNKPTKSLYPSKAKPGQSTDKVTLKPRKLVNEERLTKTQDVDEISVTIDIEEDEVIDPTTHRPKVKARSKINSLNDSVHDFPDTQLPESALNPSQANRTNVSKLTIKEFNSQLSPWLSGRINNPTFEVSNHKQRTMATDTFELDRRQSEEIRLLKEKTDDLECQIKIKDREIETSKWIEKEMQRRLQNTGDLLSLKNQVKDLQRSLDFQERINQDLTNDNAKLYDEMNIRERKLLELQSEVNNLDKIVATKNYLKETEENQKMLDQIDLLQRQILDKDIEIKDDHHKINSLTREIEKLDKDLYLKNMKLNDLASEVAQYQNEIIAQERNHFSTLECLKSKERENDMLLQNVRKVEGFERKWENLEDENLFLKQSLQELEDQCKELEKRQESSYEVTSLLEEVRDTIIERNRLNEENDNLSERLRIAESVLKEKTYEQIGLLKENDQLKTFIVDLEEENGLYRKFENEVNELDGQLRESEKSRNVLENQLVQLKPQIQKLQVKSLEKDHLIIQLVQELKSQVGYLPTDLRKEINKNDIKPSGNNDNDIPEIYLS